MANQTETVWWIGDSVTTLDMLTMECNLTYTIASVKDGVSVADVFGHSADIAMFIECADGLDLLA
jgi:hypothetical protein